MNASQSLSQKNGLVGGELSVSREAYSPQINCVAKDAGRRWPSAARIGQTIDEARYIKEKAQFGRVLGEKLDPEQTCEYQ